MVTTPTPPIATVQPSARASFARVAGGLGLFCVLALLSGACAKARAEAMPDGPPLEVPSPPARVLAPVAEPEPVLAAVPEEPPVVPPPPPARTPPRRPPVAAAPEPATPAPSDAPAETRELRAPTGTSSAANERGVRDLLARASRDLGRVSYGRLSADGKDQYDQSRRFSEQAEEALRARNVVFAATLADKAATLAAELLTR